CFENGNSAILAKLKNGIGFGTTEFHVIRTQKDYLNKYLYYVFQSERFRQEGVSSMYGVAGLKRIPSEFIANYKFAIPNLNEQVEVANYLDKKTEMIFEAISYIKLQIKSLKEYRQSLIYEAVTGKIDVREYKKVLS